MYLKSHDTFVSLNGSSNYLLRTSGPETPRSAAGNPASVNGEKFETYQAGGGGFQWTVLITAASVYGGETGNPSSPRFGLEHRMYDATMCCIIITMRGP